MRGVGEEGSKKIHRCDFAWRNEVCLRGRGKKGGGGVRELVPGGLGFLCCCEDELRYTYGIRLLNFGEREEKAEGFELIFRLILWSFTGGILVGARWSDGSGATMFLCGLFACWVLERRGEEKRGMVQG